MNKDKIGYFETVNKTSGKIEKSSTRLQQFFMLIFIFIFTPLYLSKYEINLDFILLTIMFLVAAFAPKHVKDFADIKDKVKPQQ
jgi:hypothetical protein